MSPLLSKNSRFKNIKKNLEESYFQFLSELREDVGEDEVSPYLSGEFQEELTNILNSDELNRYSPLRFYWLNLIDKLVDTLSLVDEGVEENNELIGYYSDSDLLGFIINLVEKEEGPEEILEQVIDFQEIQIVSFYHLHISKEEWQPNGPVSYPLTPEIGETNGVLVLGEDKDIYILPNLKGEGIIPIAGFFPQKKELQVLVKENIETISASNPDLISNIDDISLIPGFDKDQNIDQAFFPKVKKAYDVIQSLSPDLKEVLDRFTHTIVPLYQEELVSYSMAIMPGFSSINIQHRDFVDMVDDLLHENGHHFLNAILEGEEELIFEDDDKIFYSPWRKALRPIRGLYHGLITFYWAYRLFKELSLWKDLENHFSHEEIQKIYFRFLEEAILIRRCAPEISEAYRLDKVSEYGMELVDLVFDELKHDQAIEEQIKEKISPTKLEEIKALENDVNSKKLI